MAHADETAGPVASKLLFENSDVNVWEMEVGAGEHFGYHHHTNDYVLFITGGADLAVHEHGRDYNFKARERAAYFIPAGGSECFDNVSSTPFREALIEIKRPARNKAPTGFTQVDALCGAEPRPGSIDIFQNDRVRVSELILAPGQSSGMMPRPCDSAVFVISGSDVTVIAKGAKDRPEQRPDKGVYWQPKCEGLELVNSGKRLYRQLCVEIL